MKSLRSICALALLAPSACATPGGGGLGIVAFDPDHHIAGAEPLIGSRRENCDAASIIGVFAPVQASTSGLEKVSSCERMRHALGWAMRVHPAGGAAYSKAGRNEAIGLLIDESDRKCLEYTQFIEQYNGNITTGFGLVSHAATSLAALATGGLAKALSTGASITTDASGRLGKGHFADKAIPVLINAFSTARAKVLKDITDGYKKEVADYSFATAVHQVFDYHALCRVDAGIDAADQAVRNQAAQAAPAAGAGATGGAAAGTGGTAQPAPQPQTGASGATKKDGG